MENVVGLDRCFSFINLQLCPPGQPVPHREAAARRPAVTISRQAGCGALVVAEKLAALLQPHTPPGLPPWTVFDRNLMEKVLADHNLPARLAKHLPEDRVNALQEIMDNVFNARPGAETIIRQTAETILHLAELGGAIIIGRGGNLITAKLKNVLHVRLVAPLEQRVQHAHAFYNMSEKAAREFCVQEDQGRRRYLKKYFNADPDDPFHHHLIINTGMVSYDEAARLLADAVLCRAGASRR